MKLIGDQKYSLYQLFAILNVYKSFAGASKVLHYTETFTMGYFIIMRLLCSYVMSDTCLEAIFFVLMSLECIMPTFGLVFILSYYVIE